MNGVLTQKELQSLLKRKDKEKTEERKVEPVLSFKEVPSQEPVDTLTEEHYFFHPDNPSHSSGYLERPYHTMVTGKQVTLPIVNGVLKTSNLLIKNELLRQGFVYMYSKPKE